ncbi:hypothetical protein ACFXON_24315 [Bacillus subtilis]
MAQNMARSRCVMASAFSRPGGQVAVELVRHLAARRLDAAVLGALLLGGGRWKLNRLSMSAVDFASL